MNNQATPRPWKISELDPKDIIGTELNGNDPYGISVINTNNAQKAKANAKLIVKAVNCHDELVEELKSLINNYRGQLSAFGEEIRDVVGNTNIAVAEHHLKLAEQALEKAGAL